MGEWNPMSCEPLMKPDEIPADNLTSPLWPKHFTVQEYGLITFPGQHPCDKRHWTNSTYTLTFDTREDGPVYHTKQHSDGLLSRSTAIAVGNGNFYTMIDVPVFDKHAFCACIGPTDPTVENALAGPLSYDFLRDAVLVGRERIVPEYLNSPMIADHWVKGPHHFWFDIT